MIVKSPLEPTSAGWSVLAGAGLLSANPGKKNIKGDTVCVVAIPPHPVPIKRTTATTVRHLIKELTLTTGIIRSQ